MVNKFGVILKSKDNKYCVVVQRFYPNIGDMKYCGLAINNQDILAGLKLYREGSQSNKIAGNKDLIVFGKFFNFKFGFPKGGEESTNRTGIDCALRELQQETGITLDRRLIKEDKFIKSRPNFRGDTTTYYIVDNYDGVKSLEALPEFQDEISEVLWLTIEQISNLPYENCSKEYRDIVDVIRGRNSRRRGPLPPMRLPPKMVDEKEMDIFTRAVVKSYHLRVQGPGGLSKANDEFITNLRRLMVLTCEKNCAENEIEEIMSESSCPIGNRKLLNKKKTKSSKAKKSSSDGKQTISKGKKPRTKKL